MPSGKKHTLLGRTVEGKPIFYIPSAVGSLLFNDPNQFLQFPREGVINLTDGASPFTIEAWIRPTSIRSPGPSDYGNIIIGDTENGGNNWSLQLLDNKVSFYSYSTSLGGTFFTSNSEIQLNEWTHVAVSYDGTSTLSIFINGVSDATFGEYYPPNNQFSVITIGNLFNTGGLVWDNGTYAYQGYITNLRINDDQYFYEMVSPFEPTAPLGYISGTTLLLLANQNEPTKDSSPGNVTITNVGSVTFSSQYPTVADCSNNDAKVLMVGWFVGPRALTRQSENLYTYFDETVYRTNSSSPWIYTNVGIPLATSLTVSQFPWQAVWPAPYTATKVCAAPSPYGIPYSSTDGVSIDVINFTLLKESVGNDQGNLLYSFDESSTTPPIPANYYAHSTWDYDAGTGDRAILAYNTSATTYYSNQPDQVPNISPLPENTWMLIVFSAGVYNNGIIPPVPSSYYVNSYFGQVPAGTIPTDGWSPAINISAV